MAADDDRSTRDAVLAVAGSVAKRGWSLAGSGAQALGSGVDDALRVLLTTRVERALRPDAGPVTTDSLIAALDATPSAVPAWLGAGMARLARTGRAAKAVGGRTPVGLALTFGPAVYSAITSNLGSLDASIAHLVTRARASGVDPDPDRLRRVAVQALTGAPIDPEIDPDHGSLLRLWIGQAGRRAVPFGERINGLRGGRTPAAIAAVLDSVDVLRLGAKVKRTGR